LNELLAHIFCNRFFLTVACFHRCIFFLWYYLNQKHRAHAVLASFWSFCSWHISRLFYLYHSSRLPDRIYIYTLFVWFQQFLFTLLKKLPHEIISCFSRPINTDSYCSSHSFLPCLEGRCYMY
jgi:hypothetical protein